LPRTGGAPTRSLRIVGGFGQWVKGGDRRCERNSRVRCPIIRPYPSGLSCARVTRLSCPLLPQCFRLRRHSPTRNGPSLDLRRPLLRRPSLRGLPIRCRAFASFAARRDSGTGRATARSRAMGRDRAASEVPGPDVRPGRAFPSALRRARRARTSRAGTGRARPRRTRPRQVPPLLRWVRRPSPTKSEDG
jgi:hypothetical protein